MRIPEEIESARYRGLDTQEINTFNTKSRVSPSPLTNKVEDNGPNDLTLDETLYNDHLHSHN